MVDNKKEIQPRMVQGERIPSPVEMPRNPEENLEVEGWMAKIEKKFARVPNATADKTDDTVVVQQPQSSQPPVTLPVNQQQLQVGRKAKTDAGVAWLVTWAIRQIKLLAKLGKQVRLQDLPEVKSTNKPTT